MSTLTQFLPQQGSVIKTLQRGTFTIGNGNSTGSASVSSVTTSKAVLNYLGAVSSSGVFADNNCRIELASSTQIDAVRQGTGLTVTISYELVEYN